MIWNQGAVPIGVFRRHSEERSDEESLFSSIVAAERFSSRKLLGEAAVLAALGMTTQDSSVKQSWSSIHRPRQVLPFPTGLYTRSRSNNLSFRESPHRYPARFPSARTTRWHGTTIETGFAAHARATARTARGFPTARAIWLYVRVVPGGIRCNSCHTRR